MKNSIYISGIISAIMLTTGALFKIMHLMGGGILLMVSIAFFTLFFLPLALWNNYTKEKKNAYLYISILITLIICFGAALFKLMHLPGAGILITVGLIAPFIIFLPAYIYYYNKSANKDITRLIAILFLLVFVALMDAFLSLRVSKNIIDYGILTNQTTNQITTVLEDRNENIYVNLSSSQIFLLDTLHVDDFRARTDELCKLIDEMRFSLVNAEGLKNEFCISEAGDINTTQLLGKDMTSMAAAALYNTGKSSLLKIRIKEYKEYIRSLNLIDLSFNLDEIFNVEDTQYEDYQESWESIHFEGPIMVWALQKLDMIKMNVKLVEAEVLVSGIHNSSEL